MAKTAQIQRLSHPSHRWVAPPVAKVPKNLILEEAMVYRFKMAQKTCEGSLHPRPEGRGIRDPPRSRCNKAIRDWFASSLVVREKEASLLSQ